MAKNTRGFGGIANSALAGAAVYLGMTLAGPAAEMGRAPVVEGSYVTLEGGYLFQEGHDVAAYGVSPSGNRFNDVFVSPGDGWFAGGSIGYVNPEPFFLGFHNIEGYVLFGSTSEDVSDHAPPFSSLSLTSVDGDSFASGGKNAKGSDERTSIEGGIRFKRDFELDENSSLTLVLSPFLVFSEEDVNASVTGGCCNVRRDGDVDTWLGGGLVAVEPETWITAGMALVGRAGVGIYGFSSEGSFSSRSTNSGPGPDPFGAHVTDSSSGVGFRGQLGAGVKFRVVDNGFLELFGDADYFSAVGTAKLPSNRAATLQRASVGTEDMWDLRAGARLTLAFR